MRASTWFTTTNGAKSDQFSYHGLNLDRWDEWVPGERMKKYNEESLAIKERMDQAYVLTHILCSSDFRAEKAAGGKKEISHKKGAAQAEKAKRKQEDGSYSCFQCNFRK
jgi:hypothetical protein